MYTHELNDPIIPGTFEHRWRLLYSLATRQDRIGMAVLRFALVIVLCWIGALKFTAYQAEDIVPLVANSPLMSFVYHHPAPEYQHYMHREGEVVPAHHRWHETNRTYPFARALGVVIVLIGVLIALHPLLPQVAAAGSFLLVLMSLTTLSFLSPRRRRGCHRWARQNTGFLFSAGQARRCSRTPSCWALAS